VITAAEAEEVAQNCFNAETAREIEHILHERFGERLDAGE